MDENVVHSWYVHVAFQAGKLKGMGKLAQLSNNIVNHSWFSCRTCDKSFDSSKVNFLFLQNDFIEFYSKPNGYVNCIMCQILINRWVVHVNTSHYLNYPLMSMVRHWDTFLNKSNNLEHYKSLWWIQNLLKSLKYYTRFRSDLEFTMILIRVLWLHM